MLDEATVDSIRSMNLEDLYDVLFHAGSKAYELLYNGEMKDASSKDIARLPMAYIKLMIDVGLLINIEAARIKLGYGSQEAVTSAVKSPRTALDGVQVGRNWFFTEQWIKTYQEKRYIGRRKKADM
jgi:hypothetical protein